MEDTKNAIDRVIKMIDEMPYIFNTEADIKGLVYSELLIEYKEKYKTGRSDSKGNPLWTNRVHTEYLIREKGGRIDTVVFETNDIKYINTKEWLGIKEKDPMVPNDLPYRPVKLQDAIEIKYNGNRGQKALEKEIKADIDRLEVLLKNNKTKTSHFIFIIRCPTKNQINAVNNVKKLYENNKIIKFHCNNEYKELFQK
ncbi:MAG: hypothetical protein Q7J68_03845 [Thermoplasmata archaeon]|nr:hypothetical protein [Thermoplasmata archaeon]